MGWDRKSHLGPAEIASFCSCFFQILVWLNPRAQWASPIQPVDEFIPLLVLLKEFSCVIPGVESCS